MLHTRICNLYLRQFTCETAKSNDYRLVRLNVSYLVTMMSLVFRIAILIVTLNFLRICELAEYQPNVYAMVEKREGEVKACGPILADLLAFTCNSKYYYKGKRADHTCKLQTFICDTLPKNCASGRKLKL